jgi:hypothetical protein
MAEVDLPQGWTRIPVSLATDEQIRDWIVYVARTVAGLSAAPSTREAYDRVVAPDELEGRGSALQLAMNEMWSCALTQDGLARFLLEDAAPEQRAKIVFLWQAYVGGRAMVDEENVADAFGARHYRRDLNMPAGVVPRRGDVHIIDAATMAHTFMQTSELDSSGRFSTVEGGEVDARGYKAIEPGSRMLRPNGTLVDFKGQGATHVLWCWIDVVKEIRGAGATVGIPAPLLVAPSAQGEIDAGTTATSSTVNVAKG